MRFFLSIVLVGSCLVGWSQTPAPWQFAFNTGATSYWGASSGPSSQGAFVSSFSTRRDLSARIRATGSLSRGTFGLTAVPHNRTIEHLQGGTLGLQFHPNWSATYRINPTAGIAFGRFSQVAWLDALDPDGLPYHVWSDGQLYDMPEDAPYARILAETRLPDYEFDTQLAQVSRWGLPIQFGLEWQVSDAWTMEAAGAMYLGVVPVEGQVQNAITAFSIGFGWRPGSTMFQDPDIPSEFLDRRADSDADGVRDRRDHCFNTPAGASVDAWGCPTDSDGDGVADHLDVEANSIVPVDLYGRTIQWETFMERSRPNATPHWDFQQIIAEPSTGTRPHLPVGQAFAPSPTQPSENP